LAKEKKGTMAAMVTGTGAMGMMRTVTMKITLVGVVLVM
jgi:hypothetical protein